MTEISEFREMRSFDLAIRKAYFKAQIRRNYAKNVVINRSDFLGKTICCVYTTPYALICEFRVLNPIKTWFETCLVCFS